MPIGVGLGLILLAVFIWRHLTKSPKDDVKSLFDSFDINKVMREAERELHITHVDGATWWYDAPLPRRWHRCRPWSTGLMKWGWVDRCACGAIHHNGDHFWLWRNSRRKGKS